MSSKLDNICLPINLDAFILNKPVCDTKGDKVLIAPITQPDYVGLRLDNSVIQHDVLPPVDLHNSRPAILNPRISKAYSTDLKPVVIANPQPEFDKTRTGFLESRLGVYLHWSLPRGYRTGTSAASGAERKDSSASQNPTFRPVPNRWLVVRILKPGYLPADAKVPPIDAWVVESDRLRIIEEMDGDVDIETEVTPFVVYDSQVDPKRLIHSQAEKYIGYRSPSLIKTKYTETSANRVPLSVMNSSNPVFADYTVHNPNVFSMKDNFEYEPGKYLQQASCDYMVVGWHSSSGDSPFGDNGLKGTLDGRIRDFFCSLDDGTSKDISHSTDKVPLLSHGVIYNVQYNADVRPDTPADGYVENFTKDIAMEPVAVGVTPLDSILTFLHAHREDTAAAEHILGAGVADTAKTVLEMTELLYATGDDYDSRVKAQDLISGQSFKTSLGGFSWHYDKKKEANGPPQTPSTTKDANGKSEMDYLFRLNELQQQLDITERMLSISRWGLFAEFFKYCSDVNNGIIARRDKNKNRMLELFGREKADTTAAPSIIQSLKNTKQRIEQEINDIASPDDPTKARLKVKKVASPAFRQRTDPTLLLAGIDSGWPSEFLDAIKVRFDRDIQAPSNQQVTGLLSNLSLPPMSGNILPTIAKLLNEASTSVKTQTGFKTWKGQPFCPIFVEWEAMFYNIDANEWAVGLGSSPMSNNNQKQIRYINPKPLHTTTNIADQDTRAVSGRILVLPQPSFALAAIVRQVLDTAGVNVPKALQGEVKDKEGKPVKDKDGNPTLTGKIDQAKLDAFVKKVEQLKFISGDLMGFTDSLLTLGTGSHIKPNVRQQGQSVKVLEEAVDIGPKMGIPVELMREILTIMDSETAKTPFGTLYDFVGSKFQPFKGVQHGQLALTKITIVDKFGQAIACPLPKKTPRKKPDIPEFPIHPCIADQLCPTILPDNTLNTVFPTTDPRTSSEMVLSPFIQITPAINQNARLNASFLIKDVGADGKETRPPWRVCNDWDNPIFGWIVVNYPDSSLQFFTGEGIFYTSLRFGGPNGTMAGIQWAPFAQPPPSVASALISQQLIDLISKMRASTTTPTADAQSYLLALWSIINGAIANMPFPPSQYSAYANAIVGKPLALVNVGWSLELAEKPKIAQHTLGKLPDPGEEERKMYSYKFPVKIGDADRPFDGLVCYWNTDENTTSSTGKTDFSTIFTYPYPNTNSLSPGDKDPRVMIEPSTFPVTSPYFIDPTTVDETKGLLKSKAEKLQTRTALIDPYTSIHFYTSILPIVSLKLPGWSLEAALRNMTAFFTLGPLLVTKDVPKRYDTSKPLEADSWIRKQEEQEKLKEEKVDINLPIAGGKGMWNWLQPYPDPSPPEAGNVIRPLYNALEVGQESGGLRNDPAPYTFIEGFLQLARPLIDKEQVKGVAGV